VLTPPHDFRDEDLIGALKHWGVAGPVVYRPVGFGSHHWQVGDRWFATVDESPDLRQLTVALRAATEVPVAIAPIPALSGEVVVPVGRFAVTLFPYVAGESFDYGDDGDPAATLTMVVETHRTRSHALPEDLTVPSIPVIGDAGPYSLRASRLLTGHAAAIARLHDRYRRLAEGIDPTRAVLTHGEPHPGNTMRTAQGWRLIDWDTARLAQPERDLWHLAASGLLATYEREMGVRVREELLELYRLRWDLRDLAELAMRFSRPHAGSADDEKAWELLEELVAGLP
jgi:spectinomycin phosphotransferase/16S rRNA (guanine(1405)-N(7))-methyltransferase